MKKKFFGCAGSSLPRTGFDGRLAGGHSSLWCPSLSLRWPLLLWSADSRCVGFSSCSTQAQ